MSAHPRSRRVVALILVPLCFWVLTTAFASSLPVTSQRLTASQSATSVPCLADVSMFNFGFSPSSVTITAGCSVRWTNTVSTNHTSTNDTTPPTWDSGNRGNGETYTQVFSSTGTFPYFCKNHKASMNATVIVQ
jgi:plastocyanin